MLNYLVLYFVIASFLQRVCHHGTVIAPESGSIPLQGGWRWIGSWRVKGALLATVLILRTIEGDPGDGYRIWWVSYVGNHSTVVWFLSIIPITLGLWFVRSATFMVMLRPFKYGYFGERVPSLHKLDMRVPLLWDAVFWGWLLICPWLPFSACFVRMFLLHTPCSDVFHAA